MFFEIMAKPDIRGYNQVPILLDINYSQEFCSNDRGELVRRDAYNFPTNPWGGYVGIPIVKDNLSKKTQQVNSEMVFNSSVIGTTLTLGLLVGMSVIKIFKKVNLVRVHRFKNG